MLAPVSLCDADDVPPVEVPCKFQLFIVSDVIELADEMDDIKLLPLPNVKNDGLSFRF